ncbi:MAG TPA: NAD(P)-binding domain-containing protein [Thermoleophilaceae bacterium]|nr:NAD(P)-binding domain-containing protein [Thermoleophilaceae bacterium]
MPSSRRRVCVIGAGSSGIASCQVLQARGIAFDCYEKGSGVGGNWRYGNDNGMSSAYESLFINTSRDIMEYASYPMPKSYPDYPHHSQIAAYFDDYVDHFGFRDRIRFRTEVTRVERAPESGWDVTTRPVDGGDEETERYDDVMVANGHHWDPRWPEPPFPGELDDSVEVTHAHYYRNSEGYEGKNVLVLGIGNSACDIAVETSRVSKMTFLAMRRGAWIIPKYIGSKPIDELAPGWIATYVPFWIQRFLLQLTINRAQGDPTKFGLPKPDHRIAEAHPTVSSDLLPRIGHGRITPKPNIARLEGDSVRFEDGSVERIDRIVYCTGYKISFPFFDPDLLDPSGDNRIELYRRVVHPDLPGLYFIGLVQPLGAIMPIAELQSEWIADVIEGRAALPGRPEMIQEIAAEQAAMRKRYVASKRHTIQVDYWPYLRQLREERKRRAAAQPIGASAGRAAKEEIAA